MIKTYMMAGEKLLFFEGELYCRIKPIEDSTNEVVATAAVAAPTGKTKKSPGPKTGKYRCSKCGEAGHSAKTCGRNREQEEAPKLSKTLQQMVQEGIDAGEGFEEICMTYPSVPAAAIHKVYKELTAGK